MEKNLDIAIDPFFSTEELNQLAIEAGFVQRSSKLNGSIFLDLIVFHSSNLKDQSLNDLSGIVKEEYLIEITKQSLHERFNASALIFLKDTLEEMLQKQLDCSRLSLDNLKPFNRILLKDSTCFQIDESLTEYYPGSGGSGSSASVRIQFEYDILSGKINDLSVNAFNEQDAKDSVATIELTEKGDLIIRDLAYMSFEVLEYISNNMRYFLCRANPNAYLYEFKAGEYVKIDFIEVTKYMQKHGIDVLEKEVYLVRQKKRLKVRLILHLLPSNEIAKRLRKARKNNLSKGGDGNLSKEYIARASLNLFITNANQSLIPTTNVWKLYRLRWQIELIFKTWKSICDLEKVKKVKKHRLECYIYSKLIIIVLGWQILWKTACQLFDKEGKALSFFKASKTLLGRKIRELRQIFFLKNESVKAFMMKFYDLSRTNHLLEKRKKEPTSLELLLGCLIN